MFLSAIDDRNLWGLRLFGLWLCLGFGLAAGVGTVVVRIGIAFIGIIAAFLYPLLHISVFRHWR
jgi:uncharacterized membrane protein YccF (DUF307 family)